MAHIIHIGNSLGVRIPKALIQQLGFKEGVNLYFKVVEEGLLISPEKRVREDWEKQFKSSNKKKSSILSGEFSNEFDEDEWKW